MLYKRLIPKIVVEKSSSRQEDDFSAILTREHRHHRVIGDPLSLIRIQQSNLVDEIMLIHRNKRYFDPSFGDQILKVCESLNTPLSAGGAVTEFSHAQVIFDSGADKIVIARSKTNLSLLEKIASEYGKQALIISVDYTNEDLTPNPEHFLEHELRIGYVQTAGEICINNVSRDGSGVGIDLRVAEMFKQVTEAPIVVGCGASKVSHLLDCFKDNFDAVTLSTFLAQTDQSIKQIRAHLHAHGIHIRTRN